MRIYLDTGVFVDYLIYRGHAGFFLRRRGRRNRTIQQLSQDVSVCLNQIGNVHEGFTSALTLYEVEEALYNRILRTTRGIPDRRRFIVSSSRSLIIQVMVIQNLYNLQIFDLSEAIISRQVQEIELQIRGIRAADSLHMATAIINNADMIISTDRHLLNLDNVFQNQNGIQIRCLDTDNARQLL